MERQEVKELMDKGTFEERPIHGALEETNISWVILSRSHAFKIKKSTSPITGFYLSER